MNADDKKRIADYMGWDITPNDTYSFADHHFDLNDASLCVQEMAKRGDIDRFFRHLSIFKGGVFIPELSRPTEEQQYYLSVDYFSADNFFNAMAEWIAAQNVEVNG